MLNAEIRKLRGGERLFLRHRDQHFGTVKVLDVEVIENRPDHQYVEIVIHYKGQAESSILYYSGRTPKRLGYLAPDFFREMPTRDQIGEFEYHPHAESRRIASR